ncbi:MAG: non-heme iron oxygenase ferredoxin subunit [Longimicrobiales bacterium]
MSDSTDSSGAAELGAEWARVCALDEVPVGELKAIQTESERIVLANVEGDLYALEDQCSHQDLPLSAGELEGTSLECIFHGAKFDVCTGRATQLPAVRPVKTFEVRVEEGAVYLRLG